MITMIVVNDYNDVDDDNDGDVDDDDAHSKSG